MSVFVDTSAFYALASRNDRSHPAVKEAFGDLARAREHLVTNSYVLCETMGLVQKRLGFDVLRGFVERVVPVVDVIVVGTEEHEAGWQLMLSSPARHFSVVDATAMVVMRQEGIRRCLALDPEFGRQGFELLP